ncbi:MAG: DUF1963 domain-containing protein [Sphingobacteriales bacterium]|nr:MAG: DUF1963 domain-containing protein [Sphingobacteriales bacterium]
MANGMVVPKVFADHWEQIEATAVDSVEIKADPSNNIKITDSSFGSMPFIPIGFDYPKDDNNSPMIPLAQLNFSEIPALAGYPEKGLLQFYIKNDDAYGLDFDDQCNPASFRVIYIETPENLVAEPDTDFIKELLNSENTPVSKPHRLSFAKKTQYLGVGDYRYNLHPFSVDDWIKDYDEDTREDLQERSYDIFSNNAHRIGGYAYFTQTDPREYNQQTMHSLLLFQIDTDDEIMWGDSGVGNFFISPEDLANKNFTRVMYNWDCC